MNKEENKTQEYNFDEKRRLPIPSKLKELLKKEKSAKESSGKDQ